MKSYRRYKGNRPKSGAKKWLTALLALVLVVVVCFGVLECIVYSGARTQVSGEPDLMVIFGCQVMPWGPSVLLQDRLNTALDYLKDHPELTVVVTGGKGDDEHLSEAQAMFDYLVARGVNADQIIMEDRATTTWENVLYTRELFRSGAFETSGNVLLVSSNFHLTRIKMLWNRVWPEDCTLSTLAAPCSHAPSRFRMFFREPLALVKSFLFDRGV